MFVPETWMAVDAISACIMIVLAVASRDGSVLRERQRRVFRYALVVFLLFTAMDALVHVTGADPVVALGLAYASHVFTAVCVLSCLVYAATCVERRQGIPMVLAVMLVVFGVADVVLLALNASFGWLFVATPGGGYEQGWAWWGQAAYLALCVMATAIYYAAARVRVNRRTSRSLLAFVAILLAGIGCQLLVAQVMVLPAFFALAALVRYADDQVEALKLDYLTGLSNRVALDAKLSRLVANGYSFGCLYIEVDDFSHVVESRGRVAADALLAEFAAMLSGCFRINDTIARYSDGSFFVVIESCDEQILSSISSRVAGVVARRAADGTLSYPVEASIGSAVFEHTDLPDELDAAACDAALVSYLARLEEAVQADCEQRRILRENAL